MIQIGERWESQIQWGHANSVPYDSPSLSGKLYEPVRTAPNKCRRFFEQLQIYPPRLSEELSILNCLQAKLWLNESWTQRLVGWRHKLRLAANHHARQEREIAKLPPAKVFWQDKLGSAAVHFRILWLLEVIAVMTRMHTKSNCYEHI